MWFFDHILANQRAILTNQHVMLNLLWQLTTKEKDMAIDLTALTAEVSNNTTVSGSVVVLLQKLAAQIKAIPPSNDPATQAQLDQLAATLTQNDTTIAGAVTANTPSA